MLKTITLYAVKRDWEYLLAYQNCKAEWGSRVNTAWSTTDIECARFFAEKLKGSEVVELTIIERVVKP